jgi:hypothetical protein
LVQTKGEPVHPSQPTESVKVKDPQALLAKTVTEEPVLDPTITALPVTDQLWAGLSQAPVMVEV